MKWLYQTAGPFLICFQKVHIVFIAVAPTDIPQTEHDGSLLFTFHSIRFISYLFDDRHFVAYEVVAFHCHLIWISLMISDAEHFFKCLLIICMFSLGKKKKRSTLVRWPIFNQIVGLFNVKMYTFFEYFRY